MTHRVRAVLFFGLALALGVTLAFAVVGLPVTILTGTGGIPGNTAGSANLSCYLDSIFGELVTDPTYGTAVIEHDPTGRNPDRRLPVMWLPGDTGRHAGGEVEILDRSGKVVARTGQMWQIGGGFYGDFWVACGYVLPPSTVQ